MAAEVPCQVAPADGCTGRPSRFTPSLCICSPAHEPRPSLTHAVEAAARHEQLGPRRSAVAHPSELRPRARAAAARGSTRAAPSRPPSGAAADHGSMGLASRAEPAYKVNQMVQYPDGRLDASFAALSDATRRGVLPSLSGPRKATRCRDRAGTTTWDVVPVARAQTRPHRVIACTTIDKRVPYTDSYRSDGKRHARPSSRISEHHTPPGAP